MSYTQKVLSNTPWKLRWKHTDEKLMASAQQFKHRAGWKRGASKHYQAARNRGILDQCCAHMVRAANPYAGDYVIYAYEFEDRHVYVGLTFLPSFRRSMHKVRGPVVEHAKVCPNYRHRQVETGLPSPEAAAEAEQRHIARYRSDGWTLLNRQKGGGLGTLKREWTKELVLVEALKFQTKQEWIKGSQMSYRVAKREGWFEEASAHMPKRDVRHLVGRAASLETRQKQSAAKAGCTLSKEHRERIAASVRDSWQRKRQTTR